MSHPTSQSEFLANKKIQKECDRLGVYFEECKDKKTKHSDCEQTSNRHMEEFMATVERRLMALADIQSRKNQKEQGPNSAQKDSEDDTVLQWDNDLDAFLEVKI
jgi:hypothetical protein